MQNSNYLKVLIEEYEKERKIKYFCFHNSMVDSNSLSIWIENDCINIADSSALRDKDCKDIILICNIGSENLSEAKKILGDPDYLNRLTRLDEFVNNYEEYCDKKNGFVLKRK